MTFVRKFYTADLHFGHAGMLTMCNRPFATVEDMDRALIDNINARVKPTDILYIVGDFAVCRDDNHVRRCFHALNGRKVLIIGNHDEEDGILKPVLASLPWDQAPAYSMPINDNGQRGFLAHYAHRTWPGEFKGAWHFYGHSHGRLPAFEKSRDVGVDCPDTGFSPLTFAELTASYQEAV